ncbi:MAG: hypothetical protein NTX64_07040, partial [Elusimicrobia bacterium]|nr:hypothetical protein [Elusimicrobiota bacterium]
MLRKHGRHLLVVPCRAGLAVLVCGILCLPPSCAWATIEAKTADVVLGQAGFTVSVQAITATAVDLENGEARLDAAGNVWVVDAYNKRVLRYSKPLSNGKAADLVFGDTTFTTSNPICTFLASPGADKMCGPWGLAFDSSGNVWVSDDFDHRILRFSAPFSNGMSADLVLGQTDLLSKVVLVVDASHMKT